MKYFNEIEDYLWGRLSAEDKLKFEQRMNEDKELAEEVAIQRLEKNMITSMEEDRLLSDMEIWRKEMVGTSATVPEVPTEEENMKEEKDGRILRLRIIRWSAVAGIAMLIGVYFLLPRETISPIAEYAVIPDRYASALKSVESSENNNAGELAIKYVRAYQALRKEQYPEAERLFVELKESAEDETWLLQAIEFNQAIIKAAEQPEEGKNMLGKIAKTSDHRYQSQAEKLLDQIEN